MDIRWKLALAATWLVVAFLMFWHLLARWRGAVHASVATLAALCITFYNGRLDYFNHEIVMLPLVVGSALALERALATRRLAAWVALGACMGAGLLAKYQMVKVSARRWKCLTNSGMAMNTGVTDSVEL